MDDNTTLINNGKCTAADVLLFALENKLALKSTDHDMIIMLHEIEFEKQGKKYKSTSSLKIIGDDDKQTAMAKTVGLPLGIAAKKILNGELNLTGLRIPVDKEIYEIVLPELEEKGIVFKEETLEIG
jgi:saccharopine dehydrogenase-like NADP-dependent oxidoreductase